MNRNEFMQAFRESDELNESLTADDCIEVFLSILKGSSDITAQLLCELILNYGGGTEFDFVIVPKSTLENCYGYIKDSGDNELMKEIEDLL